MTAAQLKHHLRKRHPASQALGRELIPGAWVTLEEWMDIDFLALSAHASPASGGETGIRYPRIGYEVKVARGDLRRELLSPAKRSKAVRFCNAFYLATPKGLLTKEEISYEEPDHFRDWKSFSRQSCPNHCYRQNNRDAHDYGNRYYFDRHKGRQRTCRACDHKGYIGVSRAEEEAPTLWIPRDVGLIEVGENGARVVKRAPTRKRVTQLSGQQLADILRWTSARPDPRHLELSARRRYR